MDGYGCVGGSRQWQHWHGEEHFLTNKFYAPLLKHRPIKYNTKTTDRHGLSSYNGTCHGVGYIRVKEKNNFLSEAGKKIRYKDLNNFDKDQIVTARRLESEHL